MFITFVYKSDITTNWNLPLKGIPWKKLFVNYEEIQNDSLLTAQSVSLKGFILSEVTDLY